VKVGDLVQHKQQTGYHDVGVVIKARCGYGVVLFEVLWCDTGTVWEAYGDQLEVISESR